MLKIGKFSKLSRVSIRMLRYYDEMGLLTPSTIDPYTGYRFYSEDQLPIVGQITALKELGFSLNDIGQILKSGMEPDLLENRLRTRQEELAALMEQTQRQLRLLEFLRQRLRKDDPTMNYHVTCKTLPERYAATVRMHIPSYDREGDLWQLLTQETGHMGLVEADPCYCTVVYHDGEFKENDVDVEAQKTVRGQYPDTEHVRFRKLPPVTFASAIFQGPYEQITEANAAIAAWVQASGYEFDGPAFNIYHVSPRETDDPNAFVTEVCYPVKR